MDMEFRGLILEIVRMFKPSTYVEIGVRAGYTFNKVAPLVKRAVAVDVRDLGKVQDLPNVEKYGMLSSRFAKLWKDPIDLLFIDADHRKEAVLADFLGMAGFVVPQTGMILLHDTHPVNMELLGPRRCGTAWEAVYAIRHDPLFREYEMFTFPGPLTGMTIMRRAPKHLGWLPE